MSTVLLVDDDAQFRRVIAAALASRGHLVVEAPCGNDGVDAIGKHRPDVVIIDALLPDGDGLAWIPRLRQRRPGVPIVFVSSFYRDMGSFKRLNDELRVAMIAHKPLEAAPFVAQIDSIIAHSAVAGDDLEGELAGLRAEYAAALPQLASDLRTALDRVRASPATDGAWNDARERAHKMRGTAGTHGIPQASTAAAAIEDALVALKGRPIEEAGEHWAAIEDALATLPTPPPAPTGAVLPATRAATRPAVTPPSRTMPSDVLVVVGGTAEAARELVAHGRSHGYAVVHVAEPHDLIERAKVRVPAAVLVDMDGRAPEMLTRIAGALRTVPGAEGVVIAVLESSTGPVPEAQAVHAGASLCMPAGTNPDVVAAAIGRLLRERPQKTRVLVVDDDVDFGNLVLAVLAPRGIAARHISDPSKLFESLDELHPDLVLLDMVMPRLNGIELCRQIRASAKWRHISVLFLTAQSSVEQRIAAFRAGADDYLVKPVVNEELLARVEVRVERAKLLRDRTDRDPLTGLILRRGFLEQLEMRMAEAHRYGRPLSLCLVDLDHFKEINDGYGHLIGDRVLATTGQLLASRLRTEDIRGRWGGEELIVALPNAPLPMARQVVDRLLEELVATPFSTDDGRDFRVSFSAGVAAFPEDGDTATALVRVADERLYEAKRGGRGRVR